VDVIELNLWKKFGRWDRLFNKSDELPLELVSGECFGELGVDDDFMVLTLLFGLVLILILELESGEIDLSWIIIPFCNIGRGLVGSIGLVDVGDIGDVGDVGDVGIDVGLEL